MEGKERARSPHVTLGLQLLPWSSFPPGAGGSAGLMQESALCPGHLMSASWDRIPGVSSLSATELLGKLTPEEWAPREQNTINSTI